MCDRPDCETCAFYARKRAGNYQSIGGNVVPDAPLAGESAAARSQRDAYTHRPIVGAGENRYGGDAALSRHVERQIASEGVTRTTPHGPDFYGAIPEAHKYFVLLQQTEGYTARAWSAANSEEARRLARALSAETGLYWRVVQVGD